MIGQRLQRARKAAGLSLRALAEQADLSHTAVSKLEKELLTPSSKQLIQLAKILQVRTEYFFRPQTITITGVEYRKKSSLGKKSLAHIEADIYDQAERWHELLALYPQQPIKAFSLPAELPESITDAAQIETLAETMRTAWNLGGGCLADLTDTLESQGVMVISSQIESQNKFDGLAGLVNNIPLIVVGQSWAGDRQRFTLAHELGHLVLKGRLSDELALHEEDLCNHFAGAFLLPKAALISHLGEHRQRLEVAELSLLKQEFGFSMQGVLYRARQLGIIPHTIADSLFKRFSYSGWRTQEPFEPYPTEKTYLFKQLVYRALAEDYFTESKAAELLGMAVTNFHQLRNIEHVEPITH